MTAILSTMVIVPPLGQRWALATDGMFDDRVVEQLARYRAEGLVAVLVPPRHYEQARVALAGVARCATHPKELEAIDVQLCFAWQGEETLARHGRALRAFAEVIIL
jgi:hypothetical protein